MTHYDVIILGSGPGGYLAAERLAAKKIKVALIEPQDIGGTCLNIGCVPTKTLLNSAKLYAHALDSAKFGVEVEGAKVNWTRVQAWKDEVVARLRRSVEFTLKKEGVDIIRGWGRLTGGHSVAVRQESASVGIIAPETSTGADNPARASAGGGPDQAASAELELDADQIIVATGGSPILPPIPGARDNPAVVDSTGMLALKEIPPSICVIGGGVIGVEFASLFSSLGSKVTVIEMMDEIVPVMDPQMAMALRNTLKQVTFMRSTKVTAIEGTKVRYEVATGEKGAIEASVILMSVGRKANIEGWGAQEVGLEIKNRAIAADARLRTNLSGIWAIGDVTGKSQLAHAAYRTAEVAVADILAVREGTKSAAQFVPETVPWALFSLPEAAGVGLTEKEAVARGYEVVALKTPYAVSGRFVAENGLTATGSIKIIAEKSTERILGVTMLGAYASEHIWGMALALERRLTLSALREMVFPHPTVSEVIREAAWSANV